MFTNIDEAFMWMATIVFFIGVIVLVVGIIILAVQASGRNVKTVSESVSKLAQRGIAEDVAGLVGNASSLLTSMNEMVRSSAGIGITLIITGMLLMASAYFLFTQLG
ncbi:MAG: hypothetical protein WCF08_09240 [Anaerolineaceae bacterium]